MAEEEMTDLVPERLDHGAKRLPVAQPDAVHRRYARDEGRVVHEQIGIESAGLLQFFPEPALALLAIEAGMGSALDRVENQEPSCRDVKRGLGEAGAVEVFVREGLPVRLPVVVVADQQAYRYPQRRQGIGQVLIGSGRTPVREVSGQDQEFRIAMVDIDIGDRGIQGHPGVATEECPAPGYQVAVCKVYELHGNVP